MTKISPEATRESPSSFCNRGGPDRRSKTRAALSPPTQSLIPELTLVLRSFRPARQVLFLLQSQAIDFDAHGLQLQLGHAFVEFFGNRKDLLLQGRVVLH